MRKLLLALFMAAVMLFGLKAEQSSARNCGTMDYLAQQMQQDPGLAQRMAQIQQQTAAYIAQQNNKGVNRTNAVITIPVVFHVVYNTATQNVSDALLLAQLNQLNLDYAKLNADASSIPSAFATVAANTNIQFCLAQRDPSGNATTGIERRSTTTTAFSTNDNMKYYANGGLNAWPASSYLNLWVCNMSGGILGYAQFPGGAAATDGVVLLYSSVGSMATPNSAGGVYGSGRTATHEVGHWLNLRHIWGDANCGSDGISDTPTHNAANYGCPTYPHLSTCSGTPVEMTMNYMDYTDDACMYMFTAGQSSAMNALFASGGARVSLTTSQGCTPPSGCGAPTNLAASNVTGTSATLGWTAVTGASSYNVQYCVSGTTSCTSTSTTTNSLAVSSLNGGTSYAFTVQAVCSAGVSTAAAGTFATLATSCGNPTALTTSGITSSGAVLSWGAVSGAVNYTVQYRLATATAWTSVTVTAATTTLSGLTANSAYAWQVTANCNGLSGTAVAGTNFTTLVATTCTDTYEPNESTSAAKTIALNTNITAKIGATSDKDYFKFSTTSPNTKLRAVLSNLPADYDMRLLSSSGSTITTSANGGTLSETIIRNVTTAASYFLYIYPYSATTAGVNTSVCYNLRVDVGSTNFRFNADGTTEDAFVDASINELVLYPNPTQNEVNVMMNADNASQYSLTIYDMVGKVAVSRSINVTSGFNKFAVDVTSLSKGIYFVEVVNADVRQVKKLVIEK